MRPPRHTRATPLLAATLAAALAHTCAPAPAHHPRSAVLLTMDTTNLSALDCYGETRNITPNLAHLATESVVYDQARTTAPVTLPAHASMLTGLYPLRHGLRDNGLEALPQSAVTLAEHAHARGLDTAAFLSAAVLASPFGLDQGFDAYDCPGGPSTSAALHINERRAPETTRAAVQWLRSRDRARPFFLWVHLFDPHYPYEPSSEFATRAPDAPYLGEVAAMDASIGVIVDTLRDIGALDETLLVVLADHGEALGRNGEESHAMYCYDTTLRIPLLVRHPDGWGAGTRSRAPVSSIDVFPTIVEALELGEAIDVDGTSLFRREPPADRGIYFETYVPLLNYGWSPLAGWLQGDAKLVHGSKPRFYDLSSDPLETKDILAERPDEVARARENIRFLAAKRTLERDGEPAIDESLRARVRELGYAGIGDASATLPHPLQPGELPDPHEHKQALVEMNRVLVLAGEKRRKEAIEVLQQLRKSDPASPFVLLHLGGMLYQEQRFDESLEAFRALLALSPELSKDQEGWIRGYVGTMLERRGDLEGALAQFERALALEPEDAVRRERVERVKQALEQ